MLVVVYQDESTVPVSQVGNKAYKMLRMFNLNAAAGQDNGAFRQFLGYQLPVGVSVVSLFSSIPFLTENEILRLSVAYLMISIR